MRKTALYDDPRLLLDAALRGHGCARVSRLLADKALRSGRQATDARGQRLQVHVLKGPSSVRRKWETREFAAGYINFYACNGAVIAPQFGDERADANAHALLRELFPGREVVQLDIAAIAAGGGGIHCTTQQQPR